MLSALLYLKKSSTLCFIRRILVQSIRLFSYKVISQLCCSTEEVCRLLVHCTGVLDAGRCEFCSQWTAFNDMMSVLIGFWLCFGVIFFPPFPSHLLFPIVLTWICVAFFQFWFDSKSVRDSVFSCIWKVCMLRKQEKFRLATTKEHVLWILKLKITCIVT